MLWWNKSNGGVSLIEFIVGLGIFMVIAVALYALLNSGLRLLTDDQNRSAALGVARQRLEQIKNLPYDDVGTIGGVPSGNLQPTETETLNNVAYEVTTDIRYYDDSFDALAPTDTVNTDYKKVVITVRWGATGSARPVQLSTNIVPTQLESTTGGGTLWIEVYDPTTDPIMPLKNATVSITAPTVVPPISTSGVTDGDGRYILPGLPPGIEAYHVIVTKPSYSTAQTYTRDPETNPNPTPPDLNVIAGEVTTEYFEISQEINLLGVHLRHWQNNSHIDVPFRLHGEAIAGTDTNGLPIYQYDQIIGPNPGGNAEIKELPSDTYSILFDEADVGYVVAGHDHPLPYTAAPQSSETITIFLADYQPFTALLTITNQANEIVTGAAVQLIHQPTSYDTTVTTSEYGQAFFQELTGATYDVTITAAGYVTYNGTIIVNGNEQPTISISAS